MAHKANKAKVYVPSRNFDALLTGIFLIQAPLSFLVFWFKHDDREDFYTYLVCLCIVAIAIKVTEFFGEQVGVNFVSRVLLASDPNPHPLSKSKSRTKFIGALWQIVIHFSMAACETYLLWDEAWVSHPETCFYPFPSDFKPSQLLRSFYVLQTAIWVCCAIFILFLL